MARRGPDDVEWKEMGSRMEQLKQRLARQEDRASVSHGQNYDNRQSLQQQPRRQQQQSHPPPNYHHHQQQQQHHHQKQQQHRQQHQQEKVPNNGARNSLQHRHSNQPRGNPPQQSQSVLQNRHSANAAAPSLLYNRSMVNTNQPPPQQQQQQQLYPPPPMKNEEGRRGSGGSLNNVPARRGSTSSNSSISSGTSRISDNMTEFDYYWRSGALGLCLVQDEKTGIPVVKRLTGASTSPEINRVEPGDQLVLIGNEDTHKHPMSSVMEMLRTMEKPVKLRFRSFSRKNIEKLPPKKENDIKKMECADVMIPELKENEYDMLWESGSLGLTLGCSKNGLPYVKRLSGKGSSKGLEQVRQFDEVVMVNEKVSELEGFESMMQLFKVVQKPAVVRFRRFDPSSSPIMSPEPVESPPPPAPVAPVKPIDELAKKTSVLAIDDANTYSVTWATGPFGLTMKEGRTNSGSVPVVTRQTGRSTTAGLKRVAIGDLLVEVGPFKAYELGFENTTKILKSIEKPVVLKFQAVVE